ncbi:Lactonase, 7-bladed beta-propeller-domain-containing protein [Hypomontagnella monticulosa]|nr:Lactonase, 7-bladed beta-propeller-domain-containing protein [Hypomontagnella monticulosa]
MRYLQAILAFIGLLAFAEAAKHQLIVGTFTTHFLYTVEYDDVAETLELVKKTPTDAASSWIALSHDKKNLYGTDWTAEKSSFVSYSLNGATDIQAQARIFGEGDCLGLRSIFVAANPMPPYTVYGNYYYDNAKCGTVMSVHDNGTLKSVIQSYQYADGSAIHGTAFSPDAKIFYSADTTNNSLWMHKVNDDGTLTYISQENWPAAKADPRHVVVHPNGGYVYVVMEGSSKVVSALSMNNELYPTQQAFSLIRSSDKAEDFWSDEVALSATNKYLWASNRAHDINRKGYISVINIEPDGKLSGQDFLTETTSSGGFANAVSPSPFDDHIAAITDNSTGFIEVWKMSVDKTRVSAIAHLDINDGGGCCANAVWYN